MRFFDFSRFLIMLAAVLQTTLYAQDGKSDRGAFILISTSGDVQYLKSNGQNKSAIKVGAVIPTSHTIKTGADGKLVVVERGT